MKVMTIAPLVGCRFDDSLQLDGISFRKMNKDDMAAMAMIEWNLYWDMAIQSFNDRDPVIVVDHSFDMVKNPNDYSINESMDRLHNSFKDCCNNALAAIRMVEPKRIGFSQIYHLDPIWITLDSFRFITEDVSPIFRPFRFGKHHKDHKRYYRRRILRVRMGDFRKVHHIDCTYLRIE